MSKKSIPPEVARIPEDYKYLSKIEQTVLGLGDNVEDNKPYVALKYYQSSHQCFSEWNKNELRAFSDFIEKLRQVNWNVIWMSGGKGDKKAAFGFTLHKERNKLPSNGAALKEVSQDIPVFELRVNQKARVHGFRMRSAFFLVWLDRNHQIYPQ